MQMWLFRYSLYCLCYMFLNIRVPHTHFLRRQKNCVTLSLQDRSSHDIRRGIHNDWSSCNSFRNVYQCVCISCGNASCYPKCNCQRCCIISFAWVIIGPINPSVSKTCAICDRIPHLVILVALGFVTKYFSASNSVDHNKPKVLESVSPLWKVI